MVATVNESAKPADFDPYHKWLGIPPEEQPPTHYRLLGLQAFESDTDAILAGVMRQSAHLKTYQLGQHAALTQKLLNEVSAAKVCLTDPQRRAAYDAQLRKEFNAKQAPAPARSAPLAAVPVASASSAPVARPVADSGLANMIADLQQSARRPAGTKAKRKLPPPKRPAKSLPRRSFAWLLESPRNLFLAVGGVAALLFLLLFAAFHMIQTPDGILVVEISDPGVTVQVLDAEGKLLIERKAGAEKFEIGVAPGKGKLRVMKSGHELVTKEFTLAPGGRTTVNARQDPKPVPPIPPPPHVTPIEEVLRSPTIMQFVETPLSEVIDYVKAFHHIGIQFDRKALAKAGVKTDVRVTVGLREPLGQALRKMLAPLRLTYEVQMNRC